MTEPVPCHFTHPHGAHEWCPAVPDPNHPKVLYLGLATVECLGIPTQNGAS